jgi:hypothetical protein
MHLVWILGSRVQNAHSQGLRGGTARNLLDTELVELELQFLQLLGEIILALSPELTSLDLGRLSQNPSVSDHMDREKKFQKFET